ncbi:aspartate/glutamate racemase family protein [Halomonas sp. 328]|uniref:aspartate/glutamate racemase family protein n=1 Tax=Halomonas sp. 328 TaxID=2776704 RepID=UPI0018A7D975|nr:aspartate/glutamate racemase family protein [Halomonas sp. 328]MBF8222512.1 aspartate/glutamate racemase family protein [Halomonas sp. 328]
MKEEESAMRLLLLNGNSNAAMTAVMADRARHWLGESVTVIEETAEEGVPYIGSRRDCALTAASTVSRVEARLARSGVEVEAILLACFGEPGLDAVREISPVPVLGMLEASVLSALQLGERFAIITPGARWPRMIEERLHALGVSHHCLEIVPVVIDDLALPAQRDEARTRVAEALAGLEARCSPSVVIIGGAAFAGLARELSAPEGGRLLDAFDAALAQSLALMHLGAQR